MIIRAFYNRFRKSHDVARRARAAWEEAIHLCESCGHRTPLAELEPLTIYPCPSCKFKGLVPCVLNRYFLYEPLGAGGVSRVYKAVSQERPHHDFAVKVLRSDRSVDEAQLRDFLFEADVHRQVSPHPGIVPFIEHDHCGGEYYHVMDFVAGDSVKRRVESFGRIPEKQALAWTLAFTETLRHIRDNGYLYRDISPGNLLIRADHSICLIDFGLALSAEEADRGDRKQPIVGTPEYMPPERIQQAGEDERSSIYSLGMLLYFMVKGEPLIKAGSHERAALQHVSAVRVAFNERMLPPDCSPGIVDLIGRMIKYNPVDRPASLEQLSQELAGLMASS